MIRKIETKVLQDTKLDLRPEKKARTLNLSDEVFSAVETWCETENNKIKAQNLDRLKKSVSQRPRKLPLIKPCDVIDCLLKKFVNGEVTLT
jgi:hypothetical protein